MVARRHALFGLLLLLFVAACLAGCGKKESVKTAQEEIIAVKVQRVVNQDLYDILTYVGDIRAQEEATVFAKVPGKVARKVKEDGSSVKKDEAIVFLDRDEVGLTYAEAPVESPINGVVGRVYVDIGAAVTTQTPVALVVDMDRVKISLDVPEKYLPQVVPGQEAKVSSDAYPGAEFSGSVSKVSPVVDTDTRTAPVEITVDNADHRLKSGMFARVNLAVGGRTAVPVVLKEALIGRGTEMYVFVVENKHAVLKKVTTGLRQGAHVAVTEGLKDGDRVVIFGQQKLRDGVAVAEEEDRQEAGQR